MFGNDFEPQIMLYV